MSLWAASGLLAQQAGGVGVEIDPDKPPPVTAPLPAWATKPADRNAAIEYWALSSSIPRELSDLLGKVDWDAAGTSTDPKTFPPSLTEAIAALEKASWQRGDDVDEASKLARCDFQIKYERGLDALLPHLGELRKLARVLRLEARAAMSKKDHERAAARIAAIFRMASHTTSDRVLISSLVGVAISSIARMETEAALAAGTLTAPQKAEIAGIVLAMVENDDPFRFKDALATERDIFLNSIIANMKTGPKGRKSVASVIDTAGADSSAIRAIPDAEIEAQGKKAVAIYDEIIAAWDDPDAKAKLASIQERIETGQGGTLARIMAPSFMKSHAALQQGRSELRALLEKLNEPEPRP